MAVRRDRSRGGRPSFLVDGSDTNLLSLNSPAEINNADRVPAIDLCRSKSHRRTSRGVPVLVDEATEDAGAEHFAGVEVVRDGGALADVGW